MHITYYTVMPDASKATKAEFGIYLPKVKLTLNRLKFVRNKNGGYFVTSPSMKVGDVYSPLWAFDKEISDSFFKEALKCVEAYIASGKVDDPEMSAKPGELFQ